MRRLLKRLVNAIIDWWADRRERNARRRKAQAVRLRKKFQDAAKGWRDK